MNKTPEIPRERPPQPQERGKEQVNVGLSPEAKREWEKELPILVRSRDAREELVRTLPSEMPERQKLQRLLAVNALA